MDKSGGLQKLKDVLTQLSYMKRYTEELIDALDLALERTYEQAPIRIGNSSRQRDIYQLGGNHGGDLHESSFERRLERAIWNKWNPSRNAHFCEECPAILSFQMPLRNSHDDSSWGAIDLIGKSRDETPVVIELKKANANDTPLRVLVEGLAYAVAVRRAWKEGQLKSEWENALKPNSDNSKLPIDLGAIPVVGIAPDAYWERCLGRQGARSRGKVCDDAWEPFKKLCQLCGDRSYPISFLSVLVEGTEPDGLPSVRSVKPISFRGDQT